MTQIDHEATARRIIEGWRDSYGGGLIYGQEIDDLIATVAAALAYRDGQIAGLHESLHAQDEIIKGLKAERDAAFVEGLKRAKGVIGDKSVWANAIQGEIDNAGRAVKPD